MKSFVGKPIGGKIFINPGTGPVNDATAADARLNIRQFVKELALSGVRIRRHARDDYGDGRYAFRLYYAGQRCEIQMPGLPTDQVRFLGTEGQNAWDYPRLYVDGSSWLWKFALSCARRQLTQTDGEGE